MNYQEITTVEKVFEHFNLEPTAVPDFSKCREKDREPLMSLYLMELTIEAINPTGFVADLSDLNQLKVALWPDIEADSDDPSGFRFAYFDWAYTNAYSTVGARRLFADRARARHFWDHFKHLFISYSVIKPVTNN